MKLYNHLPEDPPSSWCRASYISGTHYLADKLFNQPGPFQDLYLIYLGLKDPDTSLVRACNKKPRHIEATKKSERDALLSRRAVFMSEDSPGGNWDAKIKTWIGLQENDKNGELVFSAPEKITPIKRESLDELITKLGFSSYTDLDQEGWVGRAPYHSAEKRFREEGKVPTKLPKELRAAIMPGLREKLSNITEEEVAGVLYLLRANPPYSLQRRSPEEFAKLSDQQKARIEREDRLQKTRVCIMLTAAREVRAMESLRRELGKDLGEEIE